jgi:hypothetical protein
MLTDGVQPSDLAGNVFEDGYRSVKATKSNGHIIVDVCFDEIINNIKREKVTLRYTYSAQRQMLRVEEVLADRVLVQWDREQIIQDLLTDVVAKLRMSSASVSEEFIASLPPYLQDKISIELAAAA